MTRPARCTPAGRAMRRLGGGRGCGSASSVSGCSASVGDARGTRSQDRWHEAVSPRHGRPRRSLVPSLDARGMQLGCQRSCRRWRRRAPASGSATRALGRGSCRTPRSHPSPLRRKGPRRATTHPGSEGPARSGVRPHRRPLSHLRSVRHLSRVSEATPTASRQLIDNRFPERGAQVGRVVRKTSHQFRQPLPALTATVNAPGLRRSGASPWGSAPRGPAPGPRGPRPRLRTGGFRSRTARVRARS